MIIFLVHAIDPDLGFKGLIPASLSCFPPPMVLNVFVELSGTLIIISIAADREFGSEFGRFLLSSLHSEIGLDGKTGCTLVLCFVEGPSY
jgi:hypothetical protein